MNEIEQLKEDLRLSELAYQMTAQINQFKGGFLARTAHEIRSPISKILSLHQLILSDLCESPEEEREFLTQAYKATQNLLKIIDEIIIISKIDYGRIPLTLTCLSLTQLLTDIYQSVHLQVTNKNLKLELISPPEDVYIVADLEKILQVFINLIDTGINLSKEGKIQISAETIKGDKFAQINIKIPCPLELWEQGKETQLDRLELTLESVKQFSQELEMSPNIRLLLAKTLIELMQGELKINAIPPDNQGENSTQIECQVPLADADCDLLEPVKD